MYAPISFLSRWSRRSSPFSSKIRRRISGFAPGRGRIETAPSIWVSMNTVSPAFRPAPTTHRFGNETTYVEPPVSCNFRPSIPLTRSPPTVYGVKRVLPIVYIVHPSTPVDREHSVGNRHREWGTPSAQRKTKFEVEEECVSRMAGTPEEMELLHRASGRKRVWIVVAVIAVVAILIAVAALAGWFSPAAQHTTLLGAGATFPYPLISKWSSVYVNLTGVQVNYQAIGSGGGITQITAKTVDFAGSDAPLKPSERAAAPGLLHIPETIGAVTAAYNVGSLST